MSSPNRLHTWLSTLERWFDLRERSHLHIGARLQRIFLALWLRPNSLRSIAQHHANTGSSPLKTTRHILALAMHDVLGPVFRLLNFMALQPYRKTRYILGQRLDRFTKRINIEHRLHTSSQALQNHPILKWGLGLLALLGFVIMAQTSLSLGGQWMFIVVCYVLASVFKRLPTRFAHLCLMMLSLLLLARYVFWRFSSSLDLNAGLEITLGYILVAAETYSWIILILGFVQTAWPLKRQALPLPPNMDQWPSVDIFIPTYNEPLSVVRPTVLAAQGIDWPTDKINIYILDDGKRTTFAQFAEELGVGYITRPDNKHAKAGNINHALQHTQSQYVAIFDCDHIPTRSFLQTCMGWFRKDPKCALVQTPHHFFSADPFERNFDVFRQMPNEGALFYGLIQDGNDYWNASFFCGSCAVIDRTALLSIGGIATETVTEDAHTALKLHAKGYTSVYLDTPQAAGLATQTLADHIGQRIRWARGMAQIFRLDNPMFKKGLTFFQRVCYSNAMLHFFYGIPRLVFLTMPLAYLYFGYHLVNAAAVTILSYALPQLIISSYTNSAIQGAYRRSFWSEVYETVLSWYIIRPTTLAFINPKLGKFNVTSKGGLIENSYFDHNIAKPYLILLLLNLIGFGMGIGRLFTDQDVGTVMMNLLWCLFNLSILGAAVGVATEAVQKHLYHRVRMVIPALLRLPGGYVINCHTEEYSTEGLTLAIQTPNELRSFSNVQVGLHRGDREFIFPAKLFISDTGRVEARFTSLSAEQETQLVQCTFGRADAWLNWAEKETRDRSLSGLKDVLQKGLVGYARLFSWLKNMARHSTKKLKNPLQRTEEWER
jgi:cellulose synthase (UDP-forming)